MSFHLFVILGRALARDPLLSRCHPWASEARPEDPYNIKPRQNGFRNKFGMTGKKNPAPKRGFFTSFWDAPCSGIFLDAPKLNLRLSCPENPPSFC